MATFPANIIYGVVTGRLILAAPDSDDPDDLPDPIPLEGSVIFTPSVKQVTDFGTSPGTGTVIPLQTHAAFLVDGSFSTKLVATNYGQPTGWTWKVTFEISTPGVVLPSFNILVPGNQVVDLAQVAPVQESTGVAVIQAVGMPRGGNTGQAVIKLSNADYHFGFGTATGGGGGGPVLVEAIEDATAVGKSLLKAADAPAARTAIGAVALGTTASTAKAGNWQPAAADISDSGAAGRDVLKAATTAAIKTALGAPTVDEISGAQTPGKNLLKATTQQAARDAIGAGVGTSSLTLGTTATTAKAGNWFPVWNDIGLKPTFHAVATSGDYEALANKPTTVIAHTHDDLIARIEALELRPTIFYLNAEGDAIPAEARPQDYIVYRSADAAPPVTTLKSLKLAGVAAGTAFTSAIVGTGDTAVDAYTTGATVRVDGTGLRELEVPNNTSAITWRWTGLTLGTLSFDFGFRPTVVTTGSSGFLVMGGLLTFTIGTTNTISLLNSSNAYVTASPAVTLGSGIYRIKGWRSSTTTGSLTSIRIYDPSGSLFWSTDRDLGVANATTFIMGRTGTFGGQAFFSNMRLHNVGGELTA